MSIINYAGVAQSSILGPLLFNIFINHVLSFLTTCEMCNYPDDNTLYTYRRNLHQVQEYWKKYFEILDNWFYDNDMVLNSHNCEFMSSAKTNEYKVFTYHQVWLKKATTKKLLSITIEIISISTNIKQMYASRKLNALSKVPSLFSCQQKKKVANSCISEQFKYCSLISMFSSKIKKLHQSSVHLCYNEIISTKYSAANDWNFQTSKVYMSPYYEWYI